MEQQKFFKNSGYSLFGIIHHAKEPKKKIGVVFCHPFAEEKVIAHRSMVSFARKFADNGISSLRFDFMGHGDSEGHFEESNIDTRISDIHCAIDYFKNEMKFERIILLGIRLGGTLAAIVSQERRDIDGLILISPIFKEDKYLNKCLRSNLATQMSTFGKIIKTREQLIQDLKSDKFINIDGYLISKALYMQMENLDLIRTYPNSNNICIIDVCKIKKNKLSENYTKLKSILEDRKKNIWINSVQDILFWTEQKIYKNQCNNIENEVINFLFNIGL